jgi:hypothetical protein
MHENQVSAVLGQNVVDSIRRDIVVMELVAVGG